MDRDQDVVDEYLRTKDHHAVGRSFGISEKRVRQILSSRGIVRAPRVQAAHGPISAAHEKIGLHLYNFRFDKGLDQHEAANALGWSVVRLRKVEKGVMNLELTDLLDVLAYTRITLENLLKVKND